MYKLAILSRDAEQYKRLVEDARLPNLSIILAQTTAPTISQLNDVEILLADPDLAAPIANQCPNLKWMQSTWAGVKPILDNSPLSFVLTGVKDVFGGQMREYVFAYLLYFSRQIATFEQQKSVKRWQVPSLNGLAGKTIGIMGVGSIGKEVARAAKLFDMRVLGLTLQSRDCQFVEKYYHPEQREQFVSQLDYLVCLLPHTSQTEELIDRQLLKAIPSRCVLINAGRGAVIQEVELCKALQEGRLSAAVLDVFDQEPLPESHPFWSTPNLHITAHSAAISKPQDIIKIFTENYLAFTNHAPLNYLITAEKAY